MKVGGVECVGRYHGLLLVECGREAWGYALSTWDAVMCHVLHGDVREAQVKRWLDGRVHARVRATLGRPGLRLLCAVAEGAEDTIVGYLAHEDTGSTWRAHFCYVRDSLRRQGVANALVKAAKGPYTRCEYTQHTLEGARLARRWGLTYAPEEGST